MFTLLCVAVVCIPVLSFLFVCFRIIVRLLCVCDLFVLLLMCFLLFV